MAFDLKIIEDANRTVLMVGMIIKNIKAEKLGPMISQFSLAEAASVVFDAMAMENMPYEQGREKYWQSVKFKMEFLKLLKPLVQFVNDEEKKVKEEMKVEL